MTFYQKIFRPSLRKKSLPGRPAGKTKRILFNCFALGLLLVITVVYLLQANIGISYYLKIEEAAQRLKSLRIENENLSQKVASLGSMANIYKISQGLKMIKVDQADYLIPSEETLAEK
ncbi:hypothetical protein ISS21_01195 [Patescibacteria group bacterium]|nr:hypothetical protein [Patescibacteria group bacterium]